MVVPDHPVVSARQWCAPVIVLALLLGACASEPVARPGARTHAVYLVNHGWHAGLVLPVGAELARAWPAGTHVPGARYVEVGWGERDFYPAPGFHLGAALKALFWRNRSVLHLVAFDPPVENYFSGGEWVRLRISDAEHARLIEVIGASFTTDAHGRAQALGPGLYGNSRFYLARERYHLFRTCNVWTAGTLRAAGLPFRTGTAFTTANLLHQARRIEQSPGAG